MNLLHISKETYVRSMGEFGLPFGKNDEAPATALCGANDGAGIIKRGHGAGLLSDNAVSSEFHCRECIAIFNAERRFG